VNRKDTRGRHELDRLDAQAGAQRERDTELERSSVQEMRLIYVRAQAVLSDLLDAETDMLTKPVGSPERQAAFDADNAAWRRTAPSVPRPRRAELRSARCAPTSPSAWRTPIED